MPTVDPAQLDIFSLDDILWIAAADTGLPNYDFPFQTFFPCRHPWRRPELITAIGRFGVTTNYTEFYERLSASGVRLIHTPTQYQLASELCSWYPHIHDLTPRSFWFDTPPTAVEVAQTLAWPIFVRASRQTSRHKAARSIVRSANEYEAVVEQYRRDPLLRWQPFVCREFVALRPVPSPPTEMIPPSFEFRTFWWHGQCVGAGPYWAAVVSYSWSEQEQEAALSVAQTAARRLQLPFVVIDVAQTIKGEWLVIECNDGQESSYAGVAPVALWQNIKAAERKLVSSPTHTE